MNVWACCGNFKFSIIPRGYVLATSRRGGLAPAGATNRLSRLPAAEGSSFVSLWPGSVQANKDSNSDRMASIKTDNGEGPCNVDAMPTRMGNLSFPSRAARTFSLAASSSHGGISLPNILTRMRERTVGKSDRQVVLRCAFVTAIELTEGPLSKRTILHAAIARYRYLIADDVGLGKTLSMAAVVPVLSLLDDKPVLILAPAILVWQRQEELEDMLGIRRQSDARSTQACLQTNSPPAPASLQGFPSSRIVPLNR